jgi:ribonuclease HI
MLTLQFDGMLQLVPEKTGQTGLLGYGWLALDNQREVARGFGLSAHRYLINSNIAEYLALIEGLEALIDLRICTKPINICGDAKCVIDQMKGIASVSSLPTQRFHRRAKKLAACFDSLAWNWIPRKENKPADRLSRRGLRQLYTIPEAYERALNQLRTNPTQAGGLVPIIDLRVYTTG